MMHEHRAFIFKSDSPSSLDAIGYRIRGNAKIHEDRQVQLHEACQIVVQQIMNNARYLRGLPYKSILRLEDNFSVRDNTGQLAYREMDAQRWAIVTVSPSQGGMRPAMMPHRSKNRIRHAER